MLFLINFCFFFVVLSPSLISCSTGINFRDLKFAYRKEVPYYNGNETLFSTTSRSFIASYGRCAVQCIEDLSCNALELCSASGVPECRATTGLMKSGSQTNRIGTCKQYAMVRYWLCQSRNVQLTLMFTKIDVTNFVEIYLCRTFLVGTTLFQIGDRVCVYLVRYIVHLIFEIENNTTVIFLKLFSCFNCSLCTGSFSRDFFFSLTKMTILDDCSDCDCVRQYKSISGGYGLNINGKLVFVLCEFESNQTWTVRYFQ